MRYRHAEDRPNSVTIAYLARRATSPVQPLRKVAQLDLVLDSHIRDRYLDHIESQRDPSSPFVASNRRETLGHGLISCRTGRSSRLLLTFQDLALRARIKI